MLPCLVISVVLKMLLLNFNNKKLSNHLTFFVEKRTRELNNNSRCMYQTLKQNLNYLWKDIGQLFQYQVLKHKLNYLWKDLAQLVQYQVLKTNWNYLWKYLEQLVQIFHLPFNILFYQGKCYRNTLCVHVCGFSWKDYFKTLNKVNEISVYGSQRTFHYNSQTV